MAGPAATAASSPYSYPHARPCLHCSSSWSRAGAGASSSSHCRWSSSLAVEHEEEDQQYPKQHQVQLLHQNKSLNLHQPPPPPSSPSSSTGRGKGGGRWSSKARRRGEAKAREKAEAKAVAARARCDEILSMHREAMVANQEARLELLRLQEGLRRPEQVPEPQSYPGCGDEAQLLWLEWPSDGLLDALQYGMPESKAGSIVRMLMPCGQGVCKIQTALNKIEKRLVSDQNHVGVGYGPGYPHFMPLLREYLFGEGQQQQQKQEQLLARQLLYSPEQQVDILCRVRWAWPKCMCSGQVLAYVKASLPEVQAEQDRLAAATLVDLLARRLPPHTITKLMAFLTSRLGGDQGSRQFGMRSKFMSNVVSKLGTHAHAVMLDLADFMKQRVPVSHRERGTNYAPLEWMLNQRRRHLQQRRELADALYHARKRFILDSLSLTAPYSVEHLEEHVQKVLSMPRAEPPPEPEGQEDEKGRAQHQGVGEQHIQQLGTLDMIMSGRLSLPRRKSEDLTLEMDAAYADSMLAALPADKFEGEDLEEEEEEVEGDGDDDVMMMQEEQEEGEEEELLRNCGRTAFLSNVPFDCTEQDISAALHACGPVESVRIIKMASPSLAVAQQAPSTKPCIPRVADLIASQNAPKSLTHAFVTFRDEEGHRKACTDCMRIFGVLIKGHTCRVQPAAMRTLLHVGNEESLPAQEFAGRIIEALGGSGRVVRPNNAVGNGAHFVPFSCRLRTSGHLTARDAEERLLAAGMKPYWIAVPHSSKSSSDARKKKKKKQHAVPQKQKGHQASDVHHLPGLREVDLGRGLLDAIDQGRAQGRS
jgi:hypothetical protein